MNVIDIHHSTWSRLISGRERQAHALLLAGPPGILKTELAYAFAASLLCERTLPGSVACQQCIACNWFFQGNHPDFRWLRPGFINESPDSDSTSKEITMDQVRALNEFLTLGTHREGDRVILITPAEAMNRNTANALLKSLEEPRPRTIFLLVSDHQEQLLPTLRSRCQTIAVQSPSSALSMQWLKDAKIEHPERWLALAGGAPKQAIIIASASHKIALSALEEQLARGRRLHATNLATELDKQLRADKSLSAYQIIDWVQRWNYDLLATLSGLPNRFFITSSNKFAILAKTTSRIKLLDFNAQTIEFKKLSEHTLNNKLFFEDFFSEYVNLYAQEA